MCDLSMLAVCAMNSMAMYTNLIMYLKTELISQPTLCWKLQILEKSIEFHFVTK